MIVNHLSNAEIEEYCKNPDLLTAHAKDIRAKLIMELIEEFTGRISSILNFLLRKGLSVLKNKTQPKKMKPSVY